MQSKQKKTLTAFAAGVMAVVMALTGTFAWQSISQRATNETVVGINPGGRLHDDFNGTNKDVYVENFTGADGADIFARVRLDEYMEIGKGAGLKDGDDGYLDKKATSLVTTPNADGITPDINDTTTWTTHIPSEDSVDDSTSPFHSYYTWDMAGETVYMPTFNTNKDSLAAEINGTLEGEGGVPYGDYEEYAVGATMNGYEIWDYDDEIPPTPEVDELAAAGINIKDVIAMDDTAVNDVETNYADHVTLNKGTDADADGKEDGVTHTAKATLGSQVITMAQWKAMGAPIGEYWVYDVDGWAYWAAPIKPGTATGLLLDGISLSNKATGDLYYAIEVVAQFASSGDWGAEDGTGFYNTNEGVAPTADALALLNKAANITETLPEALQEIGTIVPGSTETVALDGEDWYVLAKENNQALLWAAESVVADRAFDADSNAWDGSDMQTYLNGDYLNSLTTLKDYAVETTLTTAQDVDRTGYTTTTTDKVFLLSEADVFGTANGTDTSEPQEYTLGRAGVLVSDAMKTTAGGLGSYLRSPRNDATYVASLASDGSSGWYTYSDAPYDSRPAMWVDLTTGDETPVTPDTPTVPEALQPLADTAVGQKVTIDSTEWWVLEKKNNQALIWAVESVVENRRFDDNSNIWEGSELQTYLNGDYLNSLTTLKDYAAVTTLTTAKDVARSDFITSTTDKVFLLTEADVFGTAEGAATSDVREYTLGEARVIVTSEMLTNTGGLGSYLRSPRDSADGVAFLLGNGSSTWGGYDNAAYDSRPALWVNLAS